MDDSVREFVKKLPEDAARRYLNQLATFKTGRPTKFCPNEHIPLMLYHYACGASLAVVCSELGISRATYFRWRKVYTSFETAHVKGRTLQRAFLDDLELNNLSNSKFQFLSLHARMRRECGVTKRATVDMPKFDESNQSEQIDLIFEGLASGDISTGQALDLIELLKNVDELTKLPDLIEQIDQIKSKLKEQ